MAFTNGIVSYSNYVFPHLMLRDTTIIFKLQRKSNRFFNYCLILDVSKYEQQYQEKMYLVNKTYSDSTEMVKCYITYLTWIK